jgi:hypothetical protein
MAVYFGVITIAWLVLLPVSVPQAFAVPTFYKWLLLYFLNLLKNVPFKLKIHIILAYT